MVSVGRLAPVPLPPPEDVAVEEDPIQLALPGTHLVPAAPPPEERLHAAALKAATDESAEPAGTASRASAFFTAFQDERGRVFRGVPREDMPAGWADWYRHALGKVDGDEGRLLAACRGYLQSDWGRSRQPMGTALAFCSPKVWVRYVPCEQPEAAEASGPPPVDVSTEAGRAWQKCLGWLHDQGKRYAMAWLGKARPVAVEDGRLLLAVPDVYFRQWVEENYGPLVERVVLDQGLGGVRWLLPEDARAREALGA
jgi:hypothetical protein